MHNFMPLTRLSVRKDAESLIRIPDDLIALRPASPVTGTAAGQDWICLVDGDEEPVVYLQIAAPVGVGGLIPGWVAWAAVDVLSATVGEEYHPLPSSYHPAGDYDGALLALIARAMEGAVGYVPAFRLIGWRRQFNATPPKTDPRWTPPGMWE